MDKRRSRGATIILIISFFVVVVFSPSASGHGDEEEGAFTPNRIQGMINVVKRDSIVVDEERYLLSLDVTFRNEEGTVLKKGRRKLRRNMRVDLIFKDSAIVEIVMYGLLMR